MYQVDHFKTEFVRTAHAKIMGRGRLALTLRQLMMAVVVGLLCSVLIRPLPTSNWFAVIGVGLGIWLGSDRAGTMQINRLLMPLQVRLRQALGRPHSVDIAADWQQFVKESNETL